MWSYSKLVGWSVIPTVWCLVVLSLPGENVLAIPGLIIEAIILAKFLDSRSGKPSLVLALEQELTAAQTNHAVLQERLADLERRLRVAADACGGKEPHQAAITALWREVDGLKTAMGEKLPKEVFWREHLEIKRALEARFGGTLSNVPNPTSSGVGFASQSAKGRPGGTCKAGDCNGEALFQDRYGVWFCREHLPGEITGTVK